MATRSYIVLRLADTDAGKEFKTPWDGTVKTSHEDKYLYVYCHFDGYPEGGVGDWLKETFTDRDYDYALQYVLEGSRSSGTESYWEMKGDKFPPYAVNSFETIVSRAGIDIEYIYVLEEQDGVIEKVSGYHNNCKYDKNTGKWSSTIEPIENF